MTSVVVICSIALSNIGKGNISDINEASEEARQCKMHYEATRDILLQAYPFRFARTAISLAEIGNLWPERWRYAYQRPSDCLKPIRMVPEIDDPDDGNALSFAVQANTIFCNQSPAKLEYTRRVEDPSLFPPLFQDALAFSLAAKIAMPLTRDQSLRKDAYELANAAMGAAQMADANEEPPHQTTARQS
jgi:hypothetical protein